MMQFRLLKLSGVRLDSRVARAMSCRCEEAKIRSSRRSENNRRPCQSVNPSAQPSAMATKTDDISFRPQSHSSLPSAHNSMKTSAAIISQSITREKKTARTTPLHKTVPETLTSLDPLPPIPESIRCPPECLVCSAPGNRIFLKKGSRQQQ